MALERHRGAGLVGSAPPPPHRPRDKTVQIIQSKVEFSPPPSRKTRRRLRRPRPAPGGLHH
ncbi:MAG: hypothetical protein MPJ22_01440, partial [Pirellulales bacterium]|nr:hypothetical protein [Pirellulales bacterium]